MDEDTCKLCKVDDTFHLMIDGVCPVGFRAEIENLYQRHLSDTKSGWRGGMRALKELRRDCAKAVRRGTHPNAQVRLDAVNRVYQRHMNEGF